MASSAESRYQERLAARKEAKRSAVTPAPTGEKARHQIAQAALRKTQEVTMTAVAPEYDYTINVVTLEDEALDHDAIERVAEILAGVGYEPTDSEPGEWLVMAKSDGSGDEGWDALDTVIIQIVPVPEESVLLDRDRPDPDGRGNRWVPKSQTFTVRLPKSFYDDHVARDLIAGNVEVERSRYYVVRLDNIVADELMSDASCYLTYVSQGALDYPNPGMAASARATIAAINAARYGK